MDTLDKRAEKLLELLEFTPVNAKKQAVIRAFLGEQEVMRYACAEIANDTANTRAKRWMLPKIFPGAEEWGDGYNKGCEETRTAILNTKPT